jgi:hypothetical protein
MKRIALTLSAWLLACLLLSSVSIMPAAAAGTSEPTLVDAGFELGTEGTALASPPFSAVGAPQRREYDDTRARVGSQSAWIVGPLAASYAGAVESSSANLTADGTEIRFWLYQDNTNKLRRFYDNAPAGLTNGSHLVLFAADGTIQVQVNKAAPPAGYITGYNTVGTQATGWTEYRIIHDFTAQTYTLSTRTVADGPWTQLKSAGAATYDIPMRGSGTVTKTGGIAFATQASANWWLDELKFAADGVVDAPPAPGDTTPPTAPATLTAVDRPADTGGAINLTWAAASDAVGVTGYKLYRGTVPGVYGPPTVLGNVTSYTDTTAVTGTSYYYVVRAFDAAGNLGVASPEAGHHQYVPPGPPLGRG